VGAAVDAAAAGSSWVGIWKTLYLADRSSIRPRTISGI